MPQPGRKGPKPKTKADDWPKPPKYPMPTGPKDKMPKFVPARPPGAPVSRPNPDGSWGGNYYDPVWPRTPGTARIANQASVKKTVAEQAKKALKKTTPKKAKKG